MTHDNPKRPERTNRLIHIGEAADVPENIAATVDLEGGAELALFNCKGNFYALENFCPHRGAPLADGFLDETNATVMCALHAWEFDLRSGRCLTEPTCIVEVYEVLIEDGALKVRV